MTTYTATFIGTDYDGPENEKRDWFLVANDALEVDYALDEDGALLDSDGAPMNANDDDAAKIIRAIENACERLLAESAVYKQLNANGIKA